MTIVKSDGQPAEPRAGLLARYPLTFYFIIALCIVNAHHSIM